MQWYAVQYGGFFAGVRGESGDGYGHRYVDLPGAEGALLGVAVVECEELQFLEQHVVGVPIIGASAHHDALMGPPLDEGERAVAHEMARARPAPAKSRHGAGIDGNPGAAGGVGEKLWGGLGEGDFEGERIAGMETHCGKIGQGAAIKRLGVFHQEEERGLGCRRGGREQAAVGIDKVPCRYRLAVGPAGGGTQMKGIN